jgi:hypothetical protein
MDLFPFLSVVFILVVCFLIVMRAAASAPAADYPLREKNENQAKAIWAKDAEIERLREALKNFCDSYEPHLQPERCQHCSEAYWAAREALGEKE